MLPFCVPPYVSHPPSHCHQLDLLSVRAIHTKREDGDFQASRPKVSEDHVLGVIFRFNSHTDGLL